MNLRSASVQSRSSGMNFLLFYMVSLPVLDNILASQKRKRILLEIEEEYANRKGSKALDFGDHSKQNLVKSRRTVEDDWRGWCEFLSKKHEECAKLHGSDEPLCNVFKNGWQKECATWDGKPK